MTAEAPKPKLVEMRTAEAPAKTAEPAARPPAPAGIPASKSRFTPRRLTLMFGLPVLVALVGGYLWLTGGRYVSTDNAYVVQDKVTVYPELAGTIASISTAQNAYVHKGDVLFQLDQRPFQIALEQADAAVATARLQVAQLRAAYTSALAAQQAATDNLTYHRGTLQRQQDLLNRGVASQAAFDQEANNLHAAELQLAQANQQVESARSGLGGNPDIKTDDHPAVMQALANRDKAALDMTHTSVRASANGVVAQTDRLLVGQYVTTSTAVLALVETDQSWVEANFKETDLTHMSVGQKATITLDAYPGHTMDATVASLGAGTGSQFSIIPAQNATGNWVKVVQRVPIRLKLSGKPDLPFRTGLSASVEVDTEHHRSLPFLGGAVEAPPAGQFVGGK